MESKRAKDAAHAVQTERGARRSLQAIGRAEMSDGGAGPAELDLRQDSLGYAIKRGQVRTYEVLFATLGPDAISPARMTALSIIGAQPGINQSALAEQLRVTRPSMVKVIDSLEGLGLVERRAIPGDRRSYSLALTEQGRRELRDMHEKTRQYEARIAERLTAQERALLISLLEKVAVSAVPPSAPELAAGKAEDQGP